MTHTADHPSPTDTPLGRRRAVSRHRRSRPPRLPERWASVLGVVLPVALLAVLAIAVAGAFGLSPERGGPLPAPVTLGAVLVEVVLLHLVARRFRLGLLAAGATVAFAMLTPPAVRASAAGVPEHLAVLALLGTVLVLSVPRERRVLVPVAAALTGAAVAIAPLALAAVPFLFVHARRTLRRRDRVPTLPIAGAVFFAVAALGWAFVRLDATTQPTIGTALLADWLGSNTLSAIVAAIALVLGLSSSRLRLLSFYALTVVLLGVWPDGDEVHRLTVLLAPALGLLVGAGTERAVRALGLRSAREFYVGAAGAAAVAVALGAGIAVSAVELGSRASADDREPAASGEPVDPAAPADPSTPRSDAPPVTPAGSAPSAPLATPSASEVASRAAAGSQLVQNPRLTLTGDARELLEAGQVDRRIPVVLAQLLTQHDLVVSDFPAVDGEPDRRQVLVAEVDGEPVAPGASSMAPLTSYLAGLTGSFVVESVTVTSDGVLAAFPPASATPAD
jgi:hypothetical protein